MQSIITDQDGIHKMNREHTNHIVMESISCEVCGTKTSHPVVQSTDRFLGGDTVYTYCRCDTCGIVYQNPRPTQATIGFLYPYEEYPMYTQVITKVNRLTRFIRRYGLLKRAKQVNRYVSSGRVLDIGCSTGDFIWEMKQKHGWSVVGIDINYNAVNYASQNIHVTTCVGIPNNSPFADGTFDAITMWNVFEHLYNPRQVIAELARLLRPGGVLVITHPNLESLDRKLFGKFWVGYELPRHIYLYPSDFLRQLMAEYGLQEVERSCLYGSHAATATSLRFLFESWSGIGIVSENFFRLITSLPARIMMTPYYILVDLLNKGSNVTTVFLKSHE